MGDNAGGHMVRTSDFVVGIEYAGRRRMVGTTGCD